MLRFRLELSDVDSFVYMIEKESSSGLENVRKANAMSSAHTLSTNIIIYSVGIINNAMKFWAAREANGGLSVLLPKALSTDLD